MSVFHTSVSVVIAVKDRSAGLVRAVESVCKQTILPEEIIIVDDASEEPVIIENISATRQSVPIIIIRNPKNIGAAQSRNIGAIAAHGKVVAFLDSDDAFADTYIENLQEAWQTSCQLRPVAVVAGFYWCDKALKPYRSQIVKGVISRERLLAEGNIVGGASVISVDKDRFISMGGFPAIFGSHDFALLLKLAKYGSIKIINKPIVFYMSPTFAENALSLNNRRQILAKLSLLKAMDDSDGAVLIRCIAKLVAIHLSMMNKNRTSIKILKFSLKKGAELDGLFMKALLVNVVGAPLFVRIQRKYAEFRGVFPYLIGQAGCGKPQLLEVSPTDHNRPIVSISVTIPVKDRPVDLTLAIASVAAQTVLPKEVIVVDDCSLQEVTADRFQGDLPFSLRILRNEHNLGAAESYNRGAKEASCPIVAFLDSDDCFQPGYIAEVAEAWERLTPRPVCIATGFEWCTNDLVPYRTQLISGKVTRSALLLRGNFVGGSSVLSVDRSAFLASGGYPNYRGSSDWGLLLRLSEMGRIDVIYKPLVLYRSPSASIIKNDTRNFRRQIVGVIGIWKSLLRTDRNTSASIVSMLVAYNLAQANKKSSSVRMLLRGVRLGNAPRSLFYKTIVVLMIGADNYAYLLLVLVNGRVFLGSVLESVKRLVYLHRGL